MLCSATALLAALCRSAGIALAGRTGSAISGNGWAESEAHRNVLQRPNSQCAAWEEQINPWNFVTLPREPEMALDIAAMAKLEAEMYRHKPGAPVRTSDLALRGSSSPPRLSANSSHDGQKADDGSEREAAFKPYYFRDRATGKIVSSNVSQPS